MHFSLCDIAFDIVKNSVEAGAKTIFVSVNERDRFFDCDIVDDGCGMSEAELERALSRWCDCVFKSN